MLRHTRCFVLTVALAILGCKTTEHQALLPFDHGCSHCPCESAHQPPGPMAPLPPAQPGPGAPLGIRLGTPCPPPDFRPGTHQTFAPPPGGPDTSCWKPRYEPGVRLLPPQSLPPDSSKSEARASAPPPPPPIVKADPPEKEPLPPLPVGIAHFSEVKTDKISAGFRPHPTDGIPWLQGKGYRSIVYLRGPGVADVNDRRLIEKYGLKYQSLEVSPDLISRELVEKLKDIIADSGNQPLFVYDKDGTCTGAMFYLYLRLYDNMSEDQAHSRAVQLGLKDEETAESQAWWNAVRKVLPDEK